MSRRTPLFSLVTVAAFAGTLTGCAPDAYTNVKATGYNAFLNQIAVSCKPLLIGARDMGYAIQHESSGGDDKYSYFIDLTSQLYYGRTSPEAYRSGISGFLGGGADTNRSLDCIMSNLTTARASTGGAPPPPPRI
jgi:hypothetical protein